MNKDIYKHTLTLSLYKYIFECQNLSLSHNLFNISLIFLFPPSARRQSFFNVESSSVQVVDLLERRTPNVERRKRRKLESTFVSFLRRQDARSFKALSSSLPDNHAGKSFSFPGFETSRVTIY